MVRFFLKVLMFLVTVWFGTNAFFGCTEVFQEEKSSARYLLAFGLLVRGAALG